MSTSNDFRFNFRKVMAKMKTLKEPKRKERKKGLDKLILLYKKVAILKGGFYTKGSKV